MNKKIINLGYQVLIVLSLLYLGFWYINALLGTINNYGFEVQWEDNGLQINTIIILIVICSVVILGCLLSLILFFLKNNIFLVIYLSLLVFVSFFWAFSFLINEYFFIDYSFYFISISEKKLITLLALSVIYSMIAWIVGKSDFIKTQYSHKSLRIT